jgi:flagellar biosynthesis/type III secretory pathway protein FliH
VELSKVERKPVGEMTAPGKWAFFFRYLTDKSRRREINELLEQEEGIAMASEVLISISKDEAEQARLRSEEKYVLDTQSRMAQAKREGQKAGLEAAEAKYQPMLAEKDRAIVARDEEIETLRRKLREAGIDG